MNNIAEIRHHIRTVSDTGKITSAMYLISSAKMRRARAMQEQNQAYVKLLEKNLRFVLGQIPEQEHPLFDAARPGRPAHIVIAGDKGLCGSYNVEVLRHARRQLEKQDRPLVYPIGHVAQEALRGGFECDDAFVYVIHEPELRHARQVVAQIAPLYLDGTISSVFMTYTTSEKMGVHRPKTDKLLPLDPQMLSAQKDDAGLMLLPDAQTLLETVSAHYLVGRVYTALVQSFFCEQYARMSAMDAAKNNADEMLSRLNLELNHARQAQITGEITEIVAGDLHPDGA